MRKLRPLKPVINWSLQQKERDLRKGCSATVLTSDQLWAGRSGFDSRHSDFILTILPLPLRVPVPCLPLVVRYKYSN